MSIKLYNGFKLKPETNVFSFRNNVSALLKPVIIHDLNKEIVDKTLHFYDLLTFGDGKLSELAKYRFEDIKFSDQNISFKDLYFNVLKDEQHVNKKYNSVSSFNFELSLMQNVSTENIMAMFFGDKKYFNLISNMAEFDTVYPYWDNSDKPANVTEDEWVFRKKEWEETFDLLRPVITQSLMIKILDDYNLEPRFAYVEKNSFILPSPEERLQKLISYRLGQMFSEENKIKGKDYPDKNHTANILADYMDFVDDEKNKTKVNEEINARLLKTLTWEEFYNLSIKNPFAG